MSNDDARNTPRRATQTNCFELECALRLSILIFVFLLFSCSSGESDDSTDSGLDFGSVADMEVHSDMSDDVTTPEGCGFGESCPCDRDTDCPRGEKCNAFDECYSSTGCGRIWNEDDPELACFFDHDRGPLNETAGTYTWPECDLDSECASTPETPFCVRRVCHGAPACETQDDCSAEQVCFLDTICVAPGRI